MIGKTTRRRAILGATILALVGAYLYGCRRQWRVNADLENTDQSAYMGYAKKMRDSGYRYWNDGNRMPVYPFIQSLLYRPGVDSETFFKQGKRLNVALSLIVLLGVYAVLRTVAQQFEAVITTLVAAFTLFAYKAPYCQPELLFYGVNLGLFALLVELVERPRAGVALAAGAVAALAHLIKGSVLPGVALTTGCLGIQALCGLRRVEDERQVHRPLVAAVLLVVTFLALLSPYLVDSKRIFGRYFYNATTTFYFWYDSWDEVVQGTRSHGDRVGWPDLPADQIPGPAKYFREHTPRQGIWRIARGLNIIRRNVFSLWTCGNYALLYLAFTGAVIAGQTRDFARWLAAGRRPLLAAFLATYFGGYLLLYAWFAPVSGGPRLVLALFLPALYVCLGFLSRSPLSSRPTRLFGRELYTGTFFVLVLLLLLIEVVTIFPVRTGSTYFGD